MIKLRSIHHNDKSNNLVQLILKKKKIVNWVCLEIQSIIFSDLLTFLTLIGQSKHFIATVSIVDPNM